MGETMRTWPLCNGIVSKDHFISSASGKLSLAETVYGGGWCVSESVPHLLLTELDFLTQNFMVLCKTSIPL